LNVYGGLNYDKSQGGTRYITNENGDVIEHNEYFPSGESWINKSLDGNIATPYKFKGKEQDSATGLYYYGARFYDPRGRCG
jgi:RHS repeat-associated protein